MFCVLTLVCVSSLRREEEKKDRRGEDSLDVRDVEVVVGVDEVVECLKSGILEDWCEIVIVIVCVYVCMFERGVFCNEERRGKKK